MVTKVHCDKHGMQFGEECWACVCEGARAEITLAKTQLNEFCKEHAAYAERMDAKIAEKDQHISNFKNIAHNTEKERYALESKLASHDEMIEKFHLAILKATESFLANDSHNSRNVLVEALNDHAEWEKTNG